MVTKMALSFKEFGDAQTRLIVTGLSLARFPGIAHYEG